VTRADILLVVVVVGDTTNGGEKASTAVRDATQDSSRTLQTLAMAARSSDTARLDTCGGFQRRSLVDQGVIYSLQSRIW
jgi:hypothetical protein